ncbi:MAG TPA: TIGR03000 domain-containing protein, partial [Gemmata sp.]|nr:TIGR03000 domain-containing protein [Gemmata sp.]
MRKLLTAVLVAAGVAAGGRAEAWQWGHHGPFPQTAAFPCANPPGWYTNTYWFAWQYPWFAYYNYNHGPYANWTTGGGFATYTTYTGHPVVYRPYLDQGGATVPTATPAANDKKDAEPKGKDSGDKLPVDKLPEAATLKVNLHADATLLFNGTAATGAGATRTFTTPTLQPGADYGYELTAEVIR